MHAAFLIVFSEQNIGPHFPDSIYFSKPGLEASAGSPLCIIRFFHQFPIAIKCICSSLLIVLAIYTMPNLYYKANCLWSDPTCKSGRWHNEHGSPVAEVIEVPIEQVGLMFSDNRWGSLCIPKSKYVITAIMNSWSSQVSNTCWRLSNVVCNNSKQILHCHFSLVSFGSKNRP